MNEGSNAASADIVLEAAVGGGVTIGIVGGWAIAAFSGEDPGVLVLAALFGMGIGMGADVGVLGVVDEAVDIELEGGVFPDMELEGTTTALVSANS